jgi:hypothetical protein
VVDSQGGPPPFPLPLEPPEAEGYRETRPLRLGAAMVGFCAGLLWFVLLACASWSWSSYVVLTLAGLVVAIGAGAVLSWRGDRGAAAGLAVVSGLIVAVVTLLAWVRPGA